MILPGKAALRSTLLKPLLSPTLQTQPCGTDLTLSKILTWTSAATLDLTNTSRQLPTTTAIPPGHLPPGNYLIEFNESVTVPLNLMAQIFPRSSLWRSGVLLHAGVVDSGYEGALGAMMQVVNPHGVTVLENARLGQIVFHEMREAVEEGYAGVYQGAKGL